MVIYYELARLHKGGAAETSYDEEFVKNDTLFAP